VAHEHAVVILAVYTAGCNVSIRLACVVADDLVMTPAALRPL